MLFSYIHSTWNNIIISILKDRGCFNFLLLYFSLRHAAADNPPERDAEYIERKQDYIANIMIMNNIK